MAAALCGQRHSLKTARQPAHLEGLGVGDRETDRVGVGVGVRDG